MPCNLLILDIDGTLVDSVAAHRETLRRSIEATPLQQREYRWSLYRHRTDSGIFAEAYQRSYGSEPSIDECDAFERLFEHQYESVCQGGLPPVPGAKSLLDSSFAAAGWRVVFATGSFRKPALHKLRQLGLRDPVLVTASEYRSRRDIIANAITTGWRGLPLAQRGVAVSVGDGMWDAQAARDLGLPFVGVAREDNADELRRLGAVAVLPDCEGVWAALETVMGPCEAVCRATPSPA